MSSPRKPFDRALFAANDVLARDTITRQLASRGLTAVPHTARYGIDLVIKDATGVITLGVECEIKRVWTGPVLPYDTIQLPERKKKYLSPDYPIEYWILNNEQTHALVIPGALVATAVPVEVRNKYVWRGELFYQIPVLECRYEAIVPPSATDTPMTQTDSIPLTNKPRPEVEAGPTTRVKKPRRSVSE